MKRSQKRTKKALTFTRDAWFAAELTEL